MTRPMEAGEVELARVWKALREFNRANALRAPRSHASHSAPSGLRPSGFDRLSQSGDRA